MLFSTVPRLTETDCSAAAFSDCTFVAIAKCRHVRKPVAASTDAMVVTGQ